MWFKLVRDRARDRGLPPLLAQSPYVSGPDRRDLVAGDCNAPTVLRLPFRLELTATA